MPRRRWIIAVCLAMMLVLAACAGGQERADQQNGAAQTRSFMLASSGEPISSPDVAVDGTGTTHVVWVQGSTDTARVVVRQLDPEGEWSAPEELSEGYRYNSASRLVTKPDGTVCAFWQATAPEAGLYMRCWTSGEWSTAERAVQPRGLTAVYAPAFTASGTPAVAYAVPPNLVAFSETELTSAGVTAGDPAFAIDAAGGFHAAWLQFANQTKEPSGLVYRYSSDAGKTWADPIALDEDGDSAFDQQLVADRQGNVHWISSSGAYRRWTARDGWGEVANVVAAGQGEARLTVDAEGRGRIALATAEGVAVAEQGDDGTWADPAPVPASAGTAVEEAVLTVDASGRVVLAWLTSKGLFYAGST